MPLEVPRTRLVGDSHGELFATLVEFATELGYTMDLETNCQGADGYCNRRSQRIGIAAALEPNARVATAVHELAHALVSLEDVEPSYAQEELLVESIAYCVCDTLGLDTTPATVPYLASWAEAAELSVLEQTAALADKLARQIEDRLTSEGTSSKPTPSTQSAHAA